MFLKKDKDKKKANYNPPDPKLYKEISKDRGEIPSIISENCDCSGNVKTDGEIQIDGSIKGNVSAKQIVIGDTGVVGGNATASFFRICGKIEGDVRAETVEITEVATVKGNIYKKSISIEHGANITGNINQLESATAKIFKIQRKIMKEED